MGVGPRTLDFPRDSRGRSVNEAAGKPGEGLLPGMGAAPARGRQQVLLEMQREGDKQFIRMELKNAMTRKAGGQETKTDQAMTLIADGEFAYTSSDAMGKPVVVKSKIDPMMTSEPKALLAELRKQNDLKLLPEGRVQIFSAGTPVIRSTRCGSNPAT